MGNAKTMIITYHKDAYFFPYVKDDDILIYEPIKNKSTLMRVLFRIPFLCLFTYSFIHDLNNVDKVVLFDSAYNRLLGLFLKHKKNGHIHLYFWNPVSKMYPKHGDKMVEEAKKLMPVYSFDHNDCQKYGIEYRPMVYSSQVPLAFKSTCTPKYDVFFLGWKKDRSQIIESLYKTVFKGKLKCLFILVGDEDRNIDDSIIYTSKRIQYEEYLNYVQSSKAILDIPQEGQEGLTIRNVESMFLKRKLITANKGIKHYNIYDGQNVFIVGEDDESYLGNFLNSKFHELEKAVMDCYDFSKWLESYK